MHPKASTSSSSSSDQQQHSYFDTSGTAMKSTTLPRSRSRPQWQEPTSLLHRDTTAHSMGSEQQQLPQHHCNHHQQQWQPHHMPSSMPPPLGLLCLASAALRSPSQAQFLPRWTQLPPPRSLPFPMQPQPSFSMGTSLLTSDKSSGSHIHLRGGSSNADVATHASSSSNTAAVTAAAVFQSGFPANSLWPLSSTQCPFLPCGIGHNRA